MKKNIIKLIIPVLFLYSGISYSQDSIFEFKEREVELPNGDVVLSQGQNSMLTSNLREIDFSFFDEDRKRIIREIVEQTMIEFFFDYQDPREDKFRDEYQYIDFEGSKIVGEVDDNYLIRLNNNQTEFINKSYYRRLNTDSAINGVIDEIEGSINYRSREMGRDLVEQNERHRNNMRLRNN